MFISQKLLGCYIFVYFFIIVREISSSSIAFPWFKRTTSIFDFGTTGRRGKSKTRSDPGSKKIKQGGIKDSVSKVFPFRDINFWMRSFHIYSSYKIAQARQFLGNRISKGAVQFNKTENMWDNVHEVNSDRMIRLCLGLRGFYLKSGQFLGTRYDFMPQHYTTKLSKLHDDVPPLEAREIREVLETELCGPLEDYFTSIDLHRPIGSASVAQVHVGVWKPTGEKVAVKIQYPKAEKLMVRDLRNLRVLAEFLQKTELKFDLLAAIKELQKQISNEFDFRNEALAMDQIGGKLRSRVDVRVPKSIFSSKRALVMTFLEGSNLCRLAEFKDESKTVPQWVKKLAGKKLLDVLASAWGVMIFELRHFNADPHPGNIIFEIRPSGPKSVGLLDWGQVKRLPMSMAVKFANMISALNSDNESKIISAFKGLGVIMENPDDLESITGIAKTMLDTKVVPGYDMNPFSEDNAIRRNAVTHLPSDLYFLVRTVQLMRGIAFAFDLDYSLAKAWGPYANQLLLSTTNQQL